MKKNSKILSVLLAIVLVSITIISATVVHAAGTMAFSVGTDYGGLFGVDTSSDATNARDLYAIAGYSAYSSTAPTVSIMRGNFTNGIKRMKSDVLLFSGHGNYNNVSYNYKGKGGNYATGVWYTTNCTTTDNYQMVGLSGNMSTVKLVTFAACLTASNNDSNITANAVNYGADTAVGWSSEINDGSHSNWLARYNDKLATGSTVLQAVTYANSFTYLDSDVKDARIYGNRSLKIKMSAKSSHFNEEVKLRNIIINTPSIEKVNNNVTKETIVNAARSNILNFDPSDYTVNIYNICENCYTADLVLTVNGIRTNSGYTMIIIDDKIIDIVDNTIDFDKTAFVSTILQCKLDSNSEVINAARNVTNSSELKTATNQEIVFYYDITNNCFQKIVFTVYQFDGTNAIGKDVYIEKIF